jgi:hypothetical protein
MVCCRGGGLCAECTEAGGISDSLIGTAAGVGAGTWYLVLELTVLMVLLLLERKDCGRSLTGGHTWCDVAVVVGTSDVVLIL